MTWNKRRAFGWLGTKVRSLGSTLSRKRSPIDIVLFVLTVAAICVVTVKPGRPSGGYGTLHILLSLMAALYLKFSEKFKRLRSTDAPKSHSWRERQAMLADIVEKLDRLKGRDKKGQSERDKKGQSERIATIRTSILTCIVSSVAELLDESTDAFCASLLIFPGSRSEQEAASPTRMLVAARSSTIRSLGVEYACDEHLVAWRAITENDVKVVDDIRASDHFANARKSYRSVVAIPVTIGENAFGTLSVDSRNAYQFVNRHEDLAFAVRPYISLLACTFHSDAVSVPCSFRSTQVSSPSG